MPTGPELGRSTVPSFEAKHRILLPAGSEVISSIVWTLLAQPPSCAGWLHRDKSTLAGTELAKSTVLVHSKTKHIPTLTGSELAISTMYTISAQTSTVQTLEA